MDQDSETHGRGPSPIVFDSEATRWLRWYELDGDHLIGEKQVAEDALAELRDIFEAPPGDALYECYAVAAQHVHRLSTLVSLPMDLSRFAYFVEADASVRPAGVRG
jgi:hypothetical protein